MQTLTAWQYDSVHALFVTGERSLLVPKEAALELSDGLGEMLQEE